MPASVNITVLDAAKKPAVGKRPKVGTKVFPATNSNGLSSSSISYTGSYDIFVYEPNGATVFAGKFAKVSLTKQVNYVTIVAPGTITVRCLLADQYLSGCTLRTWYEAGERKPYPGVRAEFRDERGRLFEFQTDEKGMCTPALPIGLYTLYAMSPDGELFADLQDIQIGDDGAAIGDSFGTTLEVHQGGTVTVSNGPTGEKR